MNENQSFLSRFGNVLLDGIQAGSALALQREFLPEDDRFFTTSPQGAVPVGAAPTTTAAPTQGDGVSLVLIAVAAFTIFKLAS